MKSARILTFIVSLTCLIVASPKVHAQFGIGAGLAAVGDNIYQAGGELEDFLRKDKQELTYGDISGDIGFYGTLRYKHPMGALRLTGDVSYIYFQASRITIVQISNTGTDPNNTDSLKATFEVGTSIIPINAGLEFTIPVDVVRPYVGAALSYTFFNRTYADAEGDQGLTDISNRSAGEAEFGAMLGAGVELSVASLTLDLGLRYSLANIFSMDENEQDIRYLQLGATLYFGDLVGNSDDDSQDD